MDCYIYTCPYCREEHDVEFSNCRFESDSFFSQRKITPLKGLKNDGGRLKAGFKNGADDCATRAISLALGLDYKVVWNDLNALIKNGTPDDGIKDSIVKKYLKTKGWIYIKTFGLNMIEEHLPSDIIILKVKGHMVCVSNKIFFDTWDCSNNGKTKIFGYFIKNDTKSN